MCETRKATEGGGYVPGTWLCIVSMTFRQLPKGHVESKIKCLELEPVRINYIFAAPTQRFRIINGVATA